MRLRGGERLRSFPPAGSPASGSRPEGPRAAPSARGPDRDRVLQRVLQLADVARPVVALEGGERVGRELQRRAPRGRRCGRGGSGRSARCPRTAREAAGRGSGRRGGGSRGPRGSGPAGSPPSGPRFVAATMRASSGRGVLSPTRSKTPLLEDAEELDLDGGAGSPRPRRGRASRRSPCSRRPTRSRTAPVNAPRTCPKSSLSRSSPGSAAQLTATNGPPLRGEWAWSARATTSLPVPLSPVMRTFASLPWSDSTRWTIRSICGERATRPWETRALWRIVSSSSAGRSTTR